MNVTTLSPQALELAPNVVRLFTGDMRPEEATVERAPPLRRLVRFTSRWRWVLLGGVAAGAVLGAAITLVLPWQYSATTRLEISRDTAHVVNIDSVERDASMFDQEFYQTEYGLLRTQVLAERVARDLGVVDDPTFFKMFGRNDAFRGPLAAPTLASRAKRNEMAGRILLSHIAVVPVRGSRLVDLRVDTPNPELSRRIAQTWGQDFIAANLERRFDASSYARQFLETRLGQLREKLEQSERDAVDYAAKQGIIDLPSPGDQATVGASGARSLVTDDLTALNSALETATADRIQAQSRLREASRPDASAEALGNEAIGALRQKRADAAADYAKMMVQFEPNYPPAQALASQVQAFDAAIAQEEGRVRTSLEQAYGAAVAREQALVARVGGLKGNLNDLRERTIQYNIYLREADTNRELYNALLQRYKEIGVAGAVENNNVSIADPARLPDKPSSPQPVLNLLLSMLAGLALSAGLAAGLDQVDEGVSDPDDLEDQIGLPLLGVVPRVKSGSPLQALKAPRSKLGEAYLAVQANLELSTAHGAPKSFAVISTRPREGKSTTAIALAQSLARARRSVVLVDADLRSPSLHTVLGVSNAVGVSNFLAGMDDLDAALHPTDFDGLCVLPAGPQPPSAADLLMGDRLRKLIHRLQERFDHVVVDSPPVLGLADAPLVASAVDAVVFAVEARAAPAGAARMAVKRLKNSQANVIGAVLTKFESNRALRTYGYDYGYGYGW